MSFNRNYDVSVYRVQEIEELTKDLSDAELYSIPRILDLFERLKSEYGVCVNESDIYMVQGKEVVDEYIVNDLQLELDDCKSEIRDLYITNDQLRSKISFLNRELVSLNEILDLFEY